MSLGNHARSGGGKVSKAQRAREGDVQKQYTPTGQPKVPSNIPGSGPQGVPPASRDKMGEFARTGNVQLIPRVVAAQTGLGTQGPKVVSSLARMGGQVRLAPGQFGVWAHPQDPTPKASDQVTSDSKKPGSLPPPAPPVY